MDRVARLAVLLLLAALFLLPSKGTLRAAAPPGAAFTGRDVIEGPVQVNLTITPPVTTPGQSVGVHIQLTNNQPAATAPIILLSLPSNLTYTETRLPAGATYNYADNLLTWRPVLSGQDATAEMNLTVNVGAADLTTPEKAILVTLVLGEQTETMAVPIWIGLPPQATIQVRPETISIGQPVQLIAQTTGTGPFTQKWDFGDGRHITTPNPQIVFPAAGTFEVTLLLSNPLAATEVKTSLIVQTGPTAAFTMEREKTTPFTPLQFTNQSGGEPPLTYWWEFGDGTTSTDEHPLHQFPVPGFYEVRLMVNSPLGVDESAQTIIVGNSPSADFLIAADTSTGTPLLAEAFFDATVTDLAWDMGDGTTYTGQLVEHTYHRVGTYPVTLTAHNEFGEHLVTKEIVVYAGSFTSFLPLMQRHDLSRPAVLGPVPERTPPQYFGIALQEGSGNTANPGGAGPTGDNLPAAVMPQVTSVPVTPEVPPTLPDGALAEAPPEVVLPPQAPLQPDATPAEALFWYINEARRLHNLPLLLYSYELSIAAQVHSEDMLFVPGILHVGSNGSRPEERQYRYGWGGYYAGEAVAWGWEGPQPVVEFWVNSPPHRVIIMNPNATHVGVGYAANANAPNIWYWTADFGLNLDVAAPLPAPQ